MNKVVNDINNSILSKGISGLKECISLHLFGANRLVDLSGKTDQQKITFINDLAKDIVSSYQEAGLSGIESLLKQKKYIG